ncbi:hypothetical protein DL767_011384 [Monosporascus sp. MG133]|nr:hypothetical protein DL767_011384 [Monosporascus sp. MG133]
MSVKRIVLKRSPSGASEPGNSPSPSPEGDAPAEDGVPVRRTGMVTRSMTRNARVKRIKLVSRDSRDPKHTGMVTRSMARNARAKRLELVNRDSPAAPAVPAVAPDGPDPNLPSVIKMFSNGRISLIRHVAKNHLVYRRSDDQSDVVEYYYGGRLFKLWDTRTRLVIYESLTDHPIRAATEPKKMHLSRTFILVAAAAAVSLTTAQFSGELPRPEEYSWGLINWQAGTRLSRNKRDWHVCVQIFGVQDPEFAGIAAFSAHCQGYGQTGIPYTLNYMDCASETGSSVATRIIDAPAGESRAHLAISYFFTTEEKTWNIMAYVLQDWASRRAPRNLTAVLAEVR